MGKAAHVLLGLVLAAVPLVAQTDAHLYSPGTNLERSQLTQLDTATRSIDVATYSFTDRELAHVSTMAVAENNLGKRSSVTAEVLTGRT